MTNGRSLLGRMVSRPSAAKEEETEPRAYSPMEFDRGLCIITELQRDYASWKTPTRAVTRTDEVEDGEKEVPIPMARVDLCGYSRRMETVVEAIRNQAFSGNPLGSEASGAVVRRVALTHGLGALYDHPVIEEAREVRRDFYGRAIRELRNADERELIADFLRVSSVEITVAGGTKRSQPVYITEPTKNEFYRLGKDLGVSYSSLGILCVALTFCQQDDGVAHPVHRAEWAEQVADFLRRVDVRTAGGDALIRRFLNRVRTRPPDRDDGGKIRTRPGGKE